jgi:aubergine
MRQETIYEILRNCRQDDPSNWQDNFKREIIGSIVLTDYNNHTYKVDDVNFDSSPSSTFMQKGVEVSYADYYKAKYNVDIRDRKQPMLVSNPKARDVRAGRTQLLFLVPELCRATGLTDKMRANFQMMKAMAEHTQMDPDRRKARLLDFTNRLYNTPASLAQLNNYNTDIERSLVQFAGRALKQETIMFGNGAT